MPDPLTHLCTALLPLAIVRIRYTGPFAVGVMLPDVASRLPSIGFDMVDRMLVDLPYALLYPWGALHSPIPAACLCGLFAYLFAPEERARVFAWTLGGVALHLGTDVLQFHHGEGYHLLFPLSMARFELGWMSSESTVPYAPWFAALTAAAWAVRIGVDRRRSADDRQPQTR